MSNDLALDGSITLITAIPGSGKSLMLCQYIDEANKRNENVYVTNIPGLTLPHIKWENPREWEQIPPGSVLVVDECQDFFPARRSGDPPSYITAMSRIRHLGVRLILATQRPEYLDTYVRGLVGPHLHLERENGKNAAKVYKHHKLIPNVDTSKGLKQFDYYVWDYPTEYYGAYTSAQVHTVKRTMKKRVKRAMIGAGVVVVAVAGVVVFLQRDVAGMKASGGRGDPTRPSVSGTAAAATRVASYTTASEYITAHQPLVPGIPGSAPVFAGRKVQSVPRLFCMSSGAGLDAQGKKRAAGCSCLTEQGTVYEVGEEQCRYVAENGAPYDPYLSPPRERSGDAERRNQPAKPADTPAHEVAVGIASVPGVGNAQVQESKLDEIGGI